MKETERSRMTPKTLFYCCFIFYLCWVSIILAQEQELSPIILWEKLRLQFSLPSIIVVPKILSPWRLISAISKVSCTTLQVRLID